MRVEYTDVEKLFDESVHDYERFYSQSAVNKRLRNIIWNEIDKIFKPGDIVLDIGCGTGIDTLHMAERGIKVVAADISSKMLICTYKKVRLKGLTDYVEILKLGTADLHCLINKRRFNGILANFGVFNLEPDLKSLSRNLYELLTDKGIVVANIVNKCCVIEMIYFAMKRRFKDIFRRFEDNFVFNIKGERIFSRAYTPWEFYRYFKGYFKVKKMIGLNILIPPHNLEHIYAKYRKLFHIADGLERIMRISFLFQQIGDMFLLVLEKKNNRFSAL